MAQALPRYCPRCGTPTWAEMQFCATCKLPVGAMLSRPDNRQANSGDYSADPQEAIAATPGHIDAASFAPISPRSQDFQPDWNSPGGPTRSPQFPSPNSPFPQGPGNWDARNNPGAQQGWSAPPQLPPSNPWSSPDPLYATNDQAAQTLNAPWDSPAPAYPPANPAGQPQWGGLSEPPAMPAPRKRKSSPALRVFIVVLILVLLAGGGYFAFSALGLHVPGLSASQATIKTTSLNSAITYAGATVTILSVQQSQNFLDDPQTASDGMVRLNLQEQNSTSVPIGWNYTQAAHLNGAGKGSLSPTYVKSAGTIAPGATQKSVVDFAVLNGGKLNTLVFQLGTDKEAQMLIPLNGQANLSHYQSKTIPQKGTLSYFGLDWTLNNAATAWSLPAQQASKGSVFLTIDLTIDNTLSQQAISGSPFDYMRIRVGGQNFAPVSTTVPVSFASGDKGKKGSATFLIPQNTTTCTLLMLSQDPGNSGQAKLDFQIG
ncbi:MAG TPA: hypothetical protein VF458_09875 [Ktedonobacteraceae bacterium]